MPVATKEPSSPADAKPQASVQRELFGKPLVLIIAMDPELPARAFDVEFHGKWTGKWLQQATNLIRLEYAKFNRARAKRGIENWTAQTKSEVNKDA